MRASCSAVSPPLPPAIARANRRASKKERPCRPCGARGGSGRPTARAHPVIMEVYNLPPSPPPPGARLCRAESSTLFPTSSSSIPRPQSPLTSSAVYICAFLRQRLEGMRAAAAARALAARAGRSRQGLRARARARPRPSGGAPARRAATTMGPPLPATSLTLGRALGSPAALCTLGVFQVGRTRRSARGGWETPPRARALRRGEGGRACAKEEEAPARASLADWRPRPPDPLCRAVPLPPSVCSCPL